MWKPSTVEDIRKWLAGEYVPNPTKEEFERQWLARIKALAAERKRSRP
jgi:hypothetical protein